MKKERLTFVLDTALVLAIFRMIWELDIPYPFNLRGFWGMRGNIFRTAVSVGWLAMLWLGLYPAWDKAKRVSRGTALAGMVLTLCVLGVPYGNRLICLSYKATLYQELYGGLMLAMTSLDYLLHALLERDNGDASECVSASRAYRRALAVAIGLLAVGMVIYLLKFRRGIYLSVAAVDVWLLAAWLLPLRKGTE